ncbi:uncharacterized protein LOC112638775 [Camponotus floridanus]|nr:uncharacterized protein LOC112638775 [Camponotus floridanus]
MLGTTHLRTTAYHPQANGMVERFHRQLKAAIRCHGGDRWTESLPTVLLGIRAAWKEDIRATAAELVYGETLRLPGQLLTKQLNNSDDAAEFIKELRRRFDELRPVASIPHGEYKSFVFRDLRTTRHVFVRHDGPKSILQPPYNGPYEVISRTAKTFVVRIQGKDVTVSIDRLKPAYILAADDGDDTGPIAGEPITDGDGGTSEDPNLPVQAERTTRSGRRIHFPDRLQVGG